VSTRITDQTLEVTPTPFSRGQLGGAHTQMLADGVKGQWVGHGLGTHSKATLLMTSVHSLFHRHQDRRLSLIATEEPFHFQFHFH